MARLNEVALRRLIKGGETTTVEFKVATPRPVEMAERLLPGQGIVPGLL